MSILRYISCLLLLGQVSDGLAQPSGSRRTITVNRSLIETLQLLNPEFFYTSDSITFSQNLEKHLYSDLRNALDPLRVELEHDSAWQHRRDLFLFMAEERFWSRAVHSERANAPGPVSERDCRAYYQSQQDLFTTPVRYQFWQVWTTDSQKEPKALELLRRKAAGGKDADLGKFAEEGLAMNLEQDMEVSNGHALYPCLTGAKVGVPTGPCPVQGSTVHVLVTQRTGGEVRPFEQVSDQCCSGARENLEALRHRELDSLFNSHYRFDRPDELR